MATCNRICLIGLDGVVGSFVLGLKRTGFRGAVVGLADKAQVQRAWALKIVSDGTEDLAKAVKGSNLVVLSRGAATSGVTLRDVLVHVDPGTIVSEMARVKGDVNQVFESSGRADVHYVGFRLAGDADGQLELDKANQFYFEHKTVILTPRGKSDLDAFSFLQEAMKRSGANVTAMSPQAHDQMLANIDQLPRLAMMAAVEHVLDPARGVPVDAVSLGVWLTEQMDELKQMYETGWSRDVELNREPVLTALDEFAARLTGLREAIRGGTIGDHLERLSGRGSAVANPAQVAGGSREIILAVGGDQKLLGRIAQMLAECKIAVESLEKMRDAEPGTFRLKLNSASDCTRAASVLSGAGVPITEI